MTKSDNQHPTGDEQQQFAIRAHRGIDLGLGEADPTVSRAQKLEAQYPNHLSLVQNRARTKHAQAIPHEIGRRSH
jgi:hypothetical protein